MRIFVTGASGWIGSALGPELIGAGHQVLGLARSDTAATAVAALGAEGLRGGLTPSRPPAPPPGPPAAGGEAGRPPGSTPRPSRRSPPAWPALASPCSSR